MDKAGLINAATLGSILKYDGQGYVFEVYRNDKGEFLIRIASKHLQQKIKPHLQYTPADKLQE